MEYNGTFISFESHLYSRQGSPIFLLLGWWSVGLSQMFSDNCNLIILVDILCVSNRVHILFKRSFLAAQHRFIKLFHLQQT